MKIKAPASVTGEAPTVDVAGIVESGVIKVNAQRTKYGNVKTAVANGKEISNLMIGAAIASQAKPCTWIWEGLEILVSFQHIKNRNAQQHVRRKAEALDTKGLKDDETSGE